MVKDPEALAAIREFLEIHGHEIKPARLQIIDDYLFYKGSIGPCTFFKRYEEFRVRARTSLDGNRFKNDAVFKASRLSAERFALGNQLASKLYKMVEGEKKVYGLFCFLKKRAIQLIKEGKRIEEAEEILTDYLRSFGMTEKRKGKVKGVGNGKGKVEQNQVRKIQRFPDTLNESAPLQGFSLGPAKAFISVAKLSPQQPWPPISHILSRKDEVRRRRAAKHRLPLLLNPP